MFIFFKLILSVFILLFFSSCSCSVSDFEGDSVSVMNWNLETFFDGEFDGNEYSNFKDRGMWSREKYSNRLDRLSFVIQKLDCDIVVMEELEKEEQLFDIMNRLSGTFDESKLYKYGYFSAAKGASIGCGVISRFPISNISVHSLDIRCDDIQPSMRPIIQLDFSKNKVDFSLFVNHWKSKSGGAEKSDFWRDCQEKQLSRLMKNASKNGRGVLACGDFNRSIEEFEYNEKENSNILLKGGMEVFSPWFSDDGRLSDIGTYWFDEKWEYIDNFFSANLKIKNFSVRTGEWCDKKNHPNRYKIYSGEGFSDHLPIVCEIEF